MDLEAQSSVAQFQPGEIIDRRYVVVELIGAGGMSAVYRVRDQVLDRDVALKVLSKGSNADEVDALRFRNEAQLTAALEHPNIVKVLAVGVADSASVFIVMELLQGQTLDQYLQEKGRLSRDEIADIFLPIISALVYAHGQHIIHRDLKPGNIMLCKADDGQIVPKILDFGIAKILEKENQSVQQYATMAMLGSPLYMSPEQINGTPTDERSDIYSLSCLMYQALTSRPPFVGETPLETMYEHLRSSVPTINEISSSMNISKELIEALIAGLAKEPSRRPPTMLAFQQQVQQALLSQNRVKGKSSRSFITVAGSLALLILAGLGGALAFRNSQQTGHKVDLGTVKVVRKKVEFSPRSGEAYLARGNELYNGGERDASIPYYKQAIKLLDPRTSASQLYTAHLDLGHCYTDHNKFDEGLKEFQKAISYAGGPATSRRLTVVGDIARCYLAKGDTKSFIKVFSEATAAAEKELAGEPSSDLAGSYALECVFLSDMGMYKEALRLGLKAQDQYSRLMQGLTFESAIDNCWEVADCYHHLGRDKDAHAELDKCRNELMPLADLEEQDGSTAARFQLRPRNLANAFLTFGAKAEAFGYLDEAEKCYKLCLKHCQSGLYMKDSRDLRVRANQGLANIAQERKQKIKPQF